MDIKLVETIKLIIERYQGRTKDSVFIPLHDFPWYNELNKQLSQLQAEGMIIKPRYFDDGVNITLS